MHPVHDIDAVLLLAVALSSKRRPAELIELVAAAELVAGELPDEAKLIDSLARLSTHGVLVEREGGFVLSAEAQQALVGEPKKAEAGARIFWVRDQLSMLRTKAEHPAVAVSAEQVAEAVKVHQAAVKASKKNLMVPKPKPPEDNGRGPNFKLRKPMPQAKAKALAQRRRKV